jgi:O-glycosyl hydrolase
MKRLAVIIAALHLAVIAGPARGQSVVNVHPTKVEQTMGGFGAGIDGDKVPALLGSLGGADRRRAYDLVYGESGAHLNVVRLTISPYGSLLGAGRYRWDQDSYTKAELSALRGVPGHPLVSAVPFSPPAQWKSNHNVKGGGVLLPQFYQAYAAYLVDFLDYMKGQHLEVDTLSVQNEPGVASPWLACTFTPEQMHGFLATLGPLVRAGGHNTRIMISEGTMWTGAWDHVAPALADPRTRPFVDVLASHSYPPVPPNPVAQDQARGRFADTAVRTGLPVWMSEMSLMIPPQPDDPGMTAALQIADYLHRDLTLARASVWIYCFAIFTNKFQGSMGVLAPPDVDPAYPQLRVPKRLWAIANYSRFAHRGWKRVAVEGSGVTTAFIDPEGGHFAVVAVNDTDHPTEVAYEFDAKVTGEVEAFVTSAALDLGKVSPPRAREHGFAATLVPRSITTFSGTLH